MIYRIVLSICLVLILFSSVLSQDSTKSPRFEPDYTWKADLDHSYISFRTMHWGIVELIGWFEDFDVTLKKESDNWETSDIDIVIYPESVRMPNMGMAGNLQGNGFFDTETYPEINFDSRYIERKSDSNYVVTGYLTIKNISRSIDWNVKFNGATHPPEGTPGFTATSAFLLADFDMNEMQDPPNEDKFVVGDSVYVRCSFRLRVEWD